MQYYNQPSQRSAIENFNEQVAILKEEHQKLFQENKELKRKLQSEQVQHSILYKQWKDLKNREAMELKRNKRFSFVATRPKAAFKWVSVGVLFVSVLSIGYFLFNQKDKNKVSTPIVTSLQTKAQPPGQIDSTKLLAKNARTTKARPLHTRNKKLQTTSNSSKSMNSAQPTEVAVNDAVSNNNNLSLYKVKSKAYFYNNPDDNVRRKAFIVHWNNSYATLKALDERNGFVYVVFKNHLGQTSRGWLQKNDLYPVDHE